MTQALKKREKNEGYLLCYSGVPPWSWTDCCSSYILRLLRFLFLFSRLIHYPPPRRYPLLASKKTDLIVRVQGIRAFENAGDTAADLFQKFVQKDSKIAEREAEMVCYC
jgi:hypothetical protein